MKLGEKSISGIYSFVAANNDIMVNCQTFYRKINGQERNEFAGQNLHNNASQH